MAQPDIYLEAGDHERLLHIETRYLAELFGDAPHCRFSQPRMQQAESIGRGISGLPGRRGAGPIR
jgi:hypothetical protein